MCECRGVSVSQCWKSIRTRCTAGSVREWPLKGRMKLWIEYCVVMNDWFGFGNFRKYPQKSTHFCKSPHLNVAKFQDISPKLSIHVATIALAMNVEKIQKSFEIEKNWTIVCLKFWGPRGAKVCKDAYVRTFGIVFFSLGVLPERSFQGRPPKYRFLIENRPIHEWKASD